MCPSRRQVAHVLLTRSPLSPEVVRRHSLVLVRLAFIRHAASVRPEPGSNSPSKNGSEPRPMTSAEGYTNHLNWLTRHAIQLSRIGWTRCPSVAWVAHRPPPRSITALPQNKPVCRVTASALGSIAITTDHALRPLRPGVEATAWYPPSVVQLCPLPCPLCAPIASGQQCLGFFLKRQ